MYDVRLKFLKTMPMTLTFIDLISILLHFDLPAQSAHLPNPSPFCREVYLPIVLTLLSFYRI